MLTTRKTVQAKRINATYLRFLNSVKKHVNSVTKRGQIQARTQMVCYIYVVVYSISVNLTRIVLKLALFDTLCPTFIVGDLSQQCVDWMPGCFPRSCNKHPYQYYVNKMCQKTCGLCEKGRPIYLFSLHHAWQLV